jgi:hypothetical protein
MKKYRDYTHDDIREAVKSSCSLADTLRKLGLKPVGGNYQTIKERIAELDLDVSHHTGKLWNKGLYLDRSKIRGKQTIKASLIRSRGHKCESCKRIKWQRQLIPLELEHIDGNRMNDSDDNLKLLCPNCHAQTITYRRRKD